MQQRPRNPIKNQHGRSKTNPSCSDNHAMDSGKPQKYQLHPPWESRPCRNTQLNLKKHQPIASENHAGPVRKSLLAHEFDRICRQSWISLWNPNPSWLLLSGASAGKPLSAIYVSPYLWTSWPAFCSRAPWKTHSLSLKKTLTKVFGSQYMLLISVCDKRTQTAKPSKEQRHQKATASNQKKHPKLGMSKTTRLKVFSASSPMNASPTLSSASNASLSACAVGTTESRYAWGNGACCSRITSAAASRKGRNMTEHGDGLFQLLTLLKIDSYVYV